MPTKSSKKGGATFGYVDQFNYPLSPCYKNTVKAGWHSGGDGSCAKKSVEGLTYDSQMSGGSGIFDWLFGDSEKKKPKKSKSTKTAKSNTTSEKKKKNKKPKKL